MGFFDFDEASAAPRNKELRGLSVEVLHKKQCDVCPLNHAGACTPHMEPAGTKRPDVYFLGAAPSDVDDQKGKHFAGSVGKFLRMRVPDGWQDSIRYNYVVRTHPPKSREPAHVEIECCRPSVIADIERTKPIAIFGFGALPLQWALGQSRVTAWTGRRAPVKIGKHTCWFYPMLDPEIVLASRRFQPRKGSAYGSDTEFQFALHMEKAFKEIDAGLPEPSVHTREDALRKVSYVTGREKGDLKRVLDYIESCYDEKIVGYDYETKRKRPYAKDAKLLTVALARAVDAFAFPLRHKQAGWTPAQLETIETALRQFLVKSKCRKVSHHLGFEQEWSGHKLGLDTVLSGTWEDSMSQSYILDERPNTHSLDVLCMEYFGLAIKGLFRLDKDHLDDAEVEHVLEYNAVDARYHRSCFLKQRKRLRDEGLEDVYLHHVRRVTAATCSTLKGVPINPDVVESFFDQFDANLRKIEKKIAGMEIARQFKKRFGHALRPSANKDIELALTKIAKVTLDTAKNKRTGKESTTTKEEALLKVDHELARAVIKWRKDNKQLSTYNLPVMTPDRLAQLQRQSREEGRDLKGESQLHPDGLLHPQFPTTKTRTWRTSSEDVNIQNWPKRGPSKVIREQVTVGDDEIIVAIDYAGIQARNVGMESGDKGLLKHYWEHYDIHSDWMEKLHKVVPTWKPLQDIGKDLSPDERRKEERGIVKNKFVFPSFFGAIGKTVASYLGIDESKGELLSEMFFDEFPDVKGWHESLREFYKENGYVTGKSGFHRRAPIEINQLINAPIQADESIIVCGAWARLCETRDPRMIPNWMIHDDLSFIFKKRELDKMLERVVPIMLHQEHDWEKVIPMEIEVSIGKNWCDIKEIAKFETTKAGGWHEITGKDGKKYSDRWDYKVGKDGVPVTRQRGW